jgi:hypothetical protein
MALLGCQEKFSKICKKLTGYQALNLRINFYRKKKMPSPRKCGGHQWGKASEILPQS